MTAPCFNERISGQVWSESLEQAKALVNHWECLGSTGTNNGQNDVTTVTFNLLTYIGFGIQYPFGEEKEQLRDGLTIPLAEVVQTLVMNLSILAILPGKILTSSIFPTGLQRVGKAYEEFKRYIGTVVRKEKAEGGSNRNNLLSVLVKASENSKTDSSAQGLSDEEFMGNMFIFNVAGQDTTANTLLFAFALLAAYPEWQEWIFEELDTVLGNKETLDYSEIYPKLERSLAIMVSASNRLWNTKLPPGCIDIL